MRLGATSKELVAALLPLTTHKQYRVRVAAVEAIQDVMHQVCPSTSYHCCDSMPPRELCISLCC